MFGYVKPYVPELLVKDHEFYRGTYCGICRAMKKHTGKLSNVGLSYDSVTLALVRMLFVEDSEINARLGRCIAHPLKKRPMLVCNEAIEYTARSFAILTYYKLLDDLSDEGLGKKIAVSFARPIYKGAKKKAKLPDIAEIIRDRLTRINDMERERVASPDLPADLFGDLLGEIFSHGLGDKDRIVTYQFGYHLGKFVYCIDAAEDYDEDLKCGKYNPYVLSYGGAPLTESDKSVIKTALILECTKMEEALELMPFGNRYTIENILKNIIYAGLPRRLSFLDPESGKENK